MQSISQIPWSQLIDRAFSPSPATWTDQCLYLIVLDRFSTGHESEALMPEDKGGILESEHTAAEWRAAGDRFCGGTLPGALSKLDYLEKLGITTIWLTPVYKQPGWDTRMYHGYGVQNFLDVDPRFGTREDLKELVAQAHQRGMYIILDVILNHAGNVFGYEWPSESETEPPFRTEGYPIRGFRDADGRPTIPLDQFPCSDPEAAIWPQELQNPDVFHRRGCITHWEEREQYLTGDFKFLKDLYLGSEHESGFQASEALETLIDVHKFWLAYADLDGFRLDAVKHMPTAASALFVNQIQNFAKSLGKENFAIFGEIPDGQAVAHQMLEATHLSASLAILDLPDLVEKLCLGQANPEDYFAYFRDTIQPVPNRVAWDSNQIVTQYDDHDQIRKGYDKARFAALTTQQSQEFLPIFLLATTCGIPSLYYGSEQGLDGSGTDDNYIREAMFGGSFGAFRSQGKHCFDTSNPTYQITSRLLQVRRERAPLRRGNQELLEISGDGQSFGFPRMIGRKLESIVAWIREVDSDRVLCALSTSPTETLTATIKARSSNPSLLFSSLERTDQVLTSANTAEMMTLKLAPNQCVCILL